jgi:hypothetical protein
MVLFPFCPEIGLSLMGINHRLDFTKLSSPSVTAFSASITPPRRNLFLSSLINLSRLLTVLIISIRSSFSSCCISTSLPGSFISLRIGSQLCFLPIGYACARHLVIFPLSIHTGEVRLTNFITSLVIDCWSFRLLS